MTVSSQHAVHGRTVGRYALFDELASGGMATVHLGRLSGPVGFSRTVAIKRLHAHFAKDPEFVTMFLDEARLCGRIRHPNVVPTLDVVATDGEIFIVMDYVAGEALSKLLKTSRERATNVPLRVAAAIVASVLHGLHAAHEAKDEQGAELGIVHRDVSPQNILVGDDGTARVLDFGVAKAAGRMQTTREGQLKGKIAYMPPEQLSGDKVTRQSDIYAASVVLWEVLTGQRLFDGETEAMVLVRALEGKIDPPSQFSAAITPEVDALLLRGLARDPAARFASARDMALALERVIGLASAYEVGEWVEALASDELARRARFVASIESASSSSARIAFAVPTNEPPHSQVSSISVSRSGVVPQVSTHRRQLYTAAVVGVALLGVGIGTVAAPNDAAPQPQQHTPRHLAHEIRTIHLVEPAYAEHKSQSASDLSNVPMAPQKSVVAPVSKVATVAPSVSATCDPPYTLDVATGRKKYKIECLK
jgi:serine/threonine-protein kinase